jgi:hypothetical protein
MINEIHAIRNRFFEISPLELKQTLKDKNEDWFSEFFRSLLEDSWFENLGQDKRNTLPITVFRALPSNTCVILVATVFDRMLDNNPLIPHGNIVDFFRKENPELYKKMTEFAESPLPLCPKEEILGILKFSLKKKYSTITQDLLEKCTARSHFKNDWGCP